jgi:hypothetical protein
MPAIPPFVLKKLYVKGSLRSESDRFSLSLRNTIAPGTITGIAGLEVDGAGVDIGRATVSGPTGEDRSVAAITASAPLQFPVGATVSVTVDGHALVPGQHALVFRVIVRDVGPLDIPITDAVS